MLKQKNWIVTAVLAGCFLFCVGSSYAAKLLLQKNPGFQGDWDNGSALPCVHGEYDVASGKCKVAGGCTAGEPQPDGECWVAADDCAYGDLQGDGQCKFLRYQKTSDYKKTWVAAEGDCENRGAHLPTIMSQAESDAVYGFFGTFCWIGYYYAGGTAKWVMDEPTVWTPSAVGGFKILSPYAQMQNPNFWYAAYYKSTSYFICEWDWEYHAIGLCPPGYSYSKEGNNGNCYGLPACPEGYTYSDGQCYGGSACPEGYTYSNGYCYGNPG